MGNRFRKRSVDAFAFERTYRRLTGKENTSGDTLSQVPAVDIYETGGHYVLDAELPGIDRGDVQIEVSNGTLTIRGDRRLNELCAGESYHRLEGFHGGFLRSFVLPDLADDARVKVELKDGVLHVVVPKSPSRQSRQD